MVKSNRKDISKIKYDFSIIIVLVLLVGFYASPLLLNLDKAFTLFPKNIPNIYANYIPGSLLRDSINKNHIFPIWAPIIEGGRLLFQYPQINFFFLTSILAVLFGELVSINFSWFVSFLIAACSMYYLCRHVLKYNILGSFFSSLIFSMSGIFSYLLEDGIEYSREILLLPLLFAFFIKAKENWKYIILCSIVLSLMVQTTLFFPVILLFIFLFSCLSSVQYKEKKITFHKEYIRNFILLCLIALFLSAFKVLSVLQLILVNNRACGSYFSTITEPNNFIIFLKRLFIAENSGPGTMYMGFIPIILCACAAIYFFRDVKRIVILLILFIIFSFGPNSPVDLHRFLWSLPIINSIREIAKYYGVIIIFLISLLAGKFFLVVNNLKPKYFIVSVAAIIILFVYLDLLNSNIGYFNAFTTKLDYKPVSGDLFQVKALNMHQGDETLVCPLAYFLSKKNIGLTNLNIILNRETKVTPKYYLIPRYAFLVPLTSIAVLPNAEYIGEAYFLDKRNIVKKVNILPNEVSIEAKMKIPDRLIINQNFDKDWFVNRGKIEEYNGLLTVRLDIPGDGLIHLVFFPRLFFAGFMLSSVSFIGCVCLLIKRT